MAEETTQNTEFAKTIPEAETNTEDKKEIAKALGCSENDVTQLCVIFQKEPHELPDIFSSLGWSADKVLKLDRTLSPIFLAVKLKIDNKEHKDACVAMCLVFDVSRGTVIDELYWVMHGRFPDWFSAKEIWEKFRININKIGGVFEKSIYSKIHAAFESVFTMDTLYNLAADDSPELRSEILESILSHCVPNVFLHEPVAEIYVERFGAARLNLGGIKNSEDVQEPDSFTNGEEVFVVCSPVIDPVNGKTAKELGEGDFIQVGLVDGPGMAGVVYRLLNKIEVDTMFPVVSSEVSATGKAAVKFLIDDEIIGIVRVPKDVLLKASKKYSQKSEQNFSKMMSWLLIMSFLLILLVALSCVVYYLTK